MIDTSGMTRGGDGSHWEGCEAVHWDCCIQKLAARAEAAEKIVEGLAKMVRWLDCKVADRITITPEQEATINEAYEIVYKAALAAKGKP